MKFFSNKETRAYLRGLADEFGESTNAVRVELNRLEKAGLLQTENDGRMKLYRANSAHTLYPELNSVVKKLLGIDKVIDDVIAQLGTVESAFITGDYAQGKDTGIIDLVLVGTIERDFLHKLVEKAEKVIKRKIRLLVLTPDEFQNLKAHLLKDDALVIWSGGKTA